MPSNTGGDNRDDDYDPVGNERLERELKAHAAKTARRNKNEPRPLTTEESHCMEVAEQNLGNMDTVHDLYRVVADERKAAAIKAYERALGIVLCLPINQRRNEAANELAALIKLEKERK
jgi:hypothetical protein